MTGGQLQGQVIDLARVYGWRVAHFRPARTTTGWATAVAADGKGYPDLTLVRGPELIFAEMKGERERLSADQSAWLQALGEVAAAAAGAAEVYAAEAGPPDDPPIVAIEAHVWTPADWPEIQRRLRPRPPTAGEAALAHLRRRPGP